VNSRERHKHLATFFVLRNVCDHVCHLSQRLHPSSHSANSCIFALARPDTVTFTRAYIRVSKRECERAHIRLCITVPRMGVHLVVHKSIHMNVHECTKGGSKETASPTLSHNTSARRHYFKLMPYQSQQQNQTKSERERHLGMHKRVLLFPERPFALVQKVGRVRAKRFVASVRRDAQYAVWNFLRGGTVFPRKQCGWAPGT
jgi:hypothetical protein